MNANDKTVGPSEKFTATSVVDIFKFAIGEKFLSYVAAMSDFIHKTYITILTLIVIGVLGYLTYRGYAYYNTSIAERFYHPDHALLKPSGILGHGLGIIGSLLIIFGVFSYMARKRWRSLAHFGRVKHWLEFHIFLCTLGPIMILYHTAFKFGGIVAISFWSMVAVFLSGVIGRFIYLQIPRSIEGRELNLSEVRDMKNDIGSIIKNDYNLDDMSFEVIVASTQRKVQVQSSNVIGQYLKKYQEDRKSIRNIKSLLKKNNLTRAQYKNVLGLVSHEIALNRKIDRLQTMQNLFKYWHVAHLPFALVMLIIMIIHVAVTIAFGYRWIF